MARVRQTPTTGNKLYLGYISAQERLFIWLLGVVGYNATNSYKIAFGKPNIKPVTASSAASKLVNDRRIQCELWRLAHYLEDGLIEFNNKVLKMPCPLS